MWELLLYNYLTRNLLLHILLGQELPTGLFYPGTIDSTIGFLYASSSFQNQK